MSKASHFLIAAAGLCGVLAVPTAINLAGAAKVVQGGHVVTDALAGKNVPTKPPAVTAAQNSRLQPYVEAQLK